MTKKKEEILLYNEILKYIKQQDDDGTKLWKLRCMIIAHEAPHKPSDPSYNGSKFNVIVGWENGEVTSEPLSVIAADDPVTCAIYAKENNLLDLDGWQQFKSIARRDKKLLRMVNQAKLQSYHMAPHYKCGYEVPWDYNYAVKHDKENGTFKDLGKGAKMPEGY